VALKVQLVRQVHLDQRGQLVRLEPKVQLGHKVHKVQLEQLEQLERKVQLDPLDRRAILET